MGKLKLKQCLLVFFSVFLLVLFSFTPSFSQQKQEGQAPSPAGEVKKEEGAPKVVVKVDKQTYRGGETIRITGQVPPGMKVNFIEITAVDAKVQVSRLDRKDFMFYLSREIPAFYHIVINEDYVAKIDKNGTIEEKPVKDVYAKFLAAKRWRIGEFLRESNADMAFITPPQLVSEIKVWKTTVSRAIIGMRGEPQPALTDKREVRRETARLIQTRFRELPRIASLSKITTNEDGTFEATFRLPDNAPPRTYTIVAVVNKDVKSDPVNFTVDVSFPKVYFPVAGTSTNVFGPLALALAVCTFGVLMGAGGGFILNPLLILIYKIPHGVVAGSVMPTVLFSQASGIYNYSRIGFISWKLGITVGIFMALGGFFGPLLNQFVTLEEYKFVFGIVLLILAALMFWQTTPGYIEKSKKEKAILEEFKRRAAAAKAAKEQKS